MRVLHLVHDARRTGVPVLASNMARALTRAGLRCSVFFACQGELAEELGHDGVEVLTAGRRIPLLWRFYRFLLVFRLFSLSHQYDILHIHSLKMAHLVPFARLFGCRAIFHVHELPRHFGLITRLAFAMADCVVFCSKACDDHFSGLFARRKVILLNAIPMPAAVCPPMHHGELKIVELASINRGKGQDLLLEAFRGMNNKDVQLLFYGPISIPKNFFYDLKKCIKDFGLEARVHFMGATSGPLEVLCSADILVLPSRSESFGLSLVEAMSLGKPVVANAVEGMREIVVDGVTGFLVPCGDTRILAEKLDYLVANPEVRKRMGEAGRQRAMALFDIEKRVADYIALYAAL